MSQWSAFVTAVVCSALVLSACNSASPRQSQCSRICEKLELCDSSTDEEDCYDECLAQDHLSDAFVAQRAECVVPDSVSCNFAVDDAAVDDCVSDALFVGRPSALLEDVCNALASKLAACERTDRLSVRTGCLRGDAVKLSEAYLEQSRECVDALCDELPRCLEDLADANNTDLSIVREEDERGRIPASTQPASFSDAGLPNDAE